MKKKTLWLLLALLGLVYFALFVPPNLTGAKDPAMLSIFEVDELAQYPHIIHMLTPGDSAYETLRNFLIYQHYFYGYPFYFLSALALLPLRVLFGADWTARTPWLVMCLRQMINVLPMLLAAVFWVRLRTRSRPAWQGLLLFVILLSLPGLVSNNLWWHPDSLAVLFVVLTFFFIERDEFRLGKNFIFAAAACGIAASLKHFGWYFGLVIPIYLGWALATRKQFWKKVLLKGAMFLLVMAFALVVTNPLLLLPQERQELIAVQKLQFQQITGGIMVASAEPYFQWGQYPSDFRIHYGELFFILLALAGAVLGIVISKRGWLDALSLAWLLPVAVTVNQTGTVRTHYFLPIVFLLMAGLMNFFIPDEERRTIRPVPTRLLDWSRWIVAAVISVQLVIFLGTDVQIYNQTLQREQTSPSLAFYARLKQEYLSTLPPAQPLLVYRDWHVYFPAGAHTRVEMDWNYKGYDFINELKPDLILLEQANVDLFSDPAVLSQAADPDAMRSRQKFYVDAKQNQIKGYQLLMKNTFALAFIKK